MAKFFRYHVFAIFAVLLSTTVLVKSLPTSVLVDTKQQQSESSSSAALNKGNCGLKRPNEEGIVFFNFSF